MSHQVGHCPNCTTQVHFDPTALVIKASRLQCWWCGVVEDIAAYELSQPGVSQETKNFWGFVGTGALVVGLIMLLDRLDGWT
jgi:hypothetical protein